MISPQIHFKNFTKSEIIDILLLCEVSINASTSRELKSIFDRMRLLLNYNCAISAIVITDENNYLDCSEFFNDSYPLEWIELYQLKSFLQIDPVVKNHFTSFEPQIWSQTYIQQTDIDHEFITLAQDFGLRDGISYGVQEIKSPEASIFSFTGISSRDIKRAIAFFKIIIPFLHIALKNYSRMQNRLKIIEDAPQSLQLSKREKEVLNWLKIGKTNWEISKILNISERTVKFHVSKIQTKLNATTRGYAVAKALQLELISL